MAVDYSLLRQAMAEQLAIKRQQGAHMTSLGRTAGNVTRQAILAGVDIPDTGSLVGSIAEDRQNKKAYGGIDATAMLEELGMKPKDGKKVDLYTALKANRSKEAQDFFKLVAYTKASQRGTVERDNKETNIVERTNAAFTTPVESVIADSTQKPNPAYSTPVEDAAPKATPSSETATLPSEKAAANRQKAARAFAGLDKKEPFQE